MKRKRKQGEESKTKRVRQNPEKEREAQNEPDLFQHTSAGNGVRQVFILI